MVEANDRKGVLEFLWPGQLLSSLFSRTQKSAFDDDSPGDGSHDATVEGNSGATQTSYPLEHLILSPQERILALVTQHGGRMKQGEIVSNTEWSESKVSRKLKKLEAAGGIMRYRLGREKLVYLPDHVPDSLKSPFAELDEEAPLAP